jgi:uncharacterized protein (DUF1800 family)
MKPSDAWAPYSPDDTSPWNIRRVVHLHRRAGFAATCGELQRDLKDGPKASIDRLLQGKARADVVSEGFEERAAVLADDAVNSRDAGRLKGWWVVRMLFGSDPLQEKLGLLWHSHFATGIDKVGAVNAMRRQNELFRKLGRGKFADLLAAAVRDPGLLVYLDAQRNLMGQPNENLARELMELFTLGIGHYTEKDVKEAARALTGWVLVAISPLSGDLNADHDIAVLHDDGQKTILGKTGRWKADDLVGILLEHKATPRRLAFRVCELLMGEGAADDKALDALAGGLRNHDLDVGRAVETVLRSRLFFAEANIGSRVLGPAEFVVGSARLLEAFDDPPSTVLLADWSARLGQDLFRPPNVGGWPGGRRWISTRAMIGRANFAAALVEGRLSRRGAPIDCLGLARKHGTGKNLPSVITFYAELVLGGVPDGGWSDRMMAVLGAPAKLTAESARRVAALTLAAPEAQVA